MEPSRKRVRVEVTSPKTTEAREATLRGSARSAAIERLAQTGTLSLSAQERLQQAHDALQQQYNEAKAQLDAFRHQQAARLQTIQRLCAGLEPMDMQRLRGYAADLVASPPQDSRASFINMDRKAVCTALGAALGTELKTHDVPTLDDIAKAYGAGAVAAWPPAWAVDPVTLDLIVDPVLLSSGTAFDRASIADTWSHMPPAPIVRLEPYVPDYRDPKTRDKVMYEWIRAPALRDAIDAAMLERTGFHLDAVLGRSPEHAVQMLAAELVGSGGLFHHQTLEIELDANDLSPFWDLAYEGDEQKLVKLTFQDLQTSNMRVRVRASISKPFELDVLMRREYGGWHNVARMNMSLFRRFLDTLGHAIVRVTSVDQDRVLFRRA